MNKKHKKLWIKMLASKLQVPENNNIINNAVRYAKTYKEALTEASRFLRKGDYK